MNVHVKCTKRRLNDSTARGAANRLDVRREPLGLVLQEVDLEVPQPHTRRALLPKELEVERLGFGRIVASEFAAPNFLVNMV